MPHPRPSTRCALILGVVLMLAGTTGWAQSGRGTITGVVKDSSGAVLPGVRVEALHVATNVRTAATTNGVGLYSLLNLPLGAYSVTFTLDGFSTLRHENITVGLTQTVTLDAVLAVGGLQDAVTVTADAPLLSTTTPEVGTTMKNDVVTSLPLSVSGGRSLENFAYALTPSVEGDNWTSRIAGGLPFTKEVVLDGTSAVIQIGGHIGESSPPMESVEEFKVLTSGIAAEYGRTGGGVFNFSLKSGTNRFRGSAYGYVRNEALNANTWQNKYMSEAYPGRAGEFKKPNDRQYIVGTSVGGPIFKDRTFYFGSYEDYRQSRFVLGPYNATVPTAAFLNGDFSALLDRGTLLGTDAAGNPIYKGAIVDPVTRLVFPNNVIPAERISAVSKKIADLFRQGYAPMVDRVSNNSALPYYNNPDFKQRQLAVKLTHQLSGGSQLSASYIWTRRPRTLVDAGGVWNPNDDGQMGGPLSRARKQNVGTDQVRVSHSQTLSPTVLNVANATFSRYNNPSVAGSASGGWPEQLGFGDVGKGNFPNIQFGGAVNGISTTRIGYEANSGYEGRVFILSDSVSWVKSRHSFKFGGEYRHSSLASHTATGVLSFNFAPDQTRFLGPSWQAQTGFGLASFLLGAVNDANKVTAGDLSGRRNYIAAYAQDDIRVNDNLTVNLGLRWETTGPWTEKDGQWATYDTTIQSPKYGIPGALVYATGGGSTFEGKRDWKEFGPRVGASYKLTERAVLRGAYGIFYQPIGADYWAGVPYGFAPGFRGDNRMSAVGGGKPAFYWDAGYPGAEVPPGTKDPDLAQWGMVSMSRDGLQAGRMQQWNAGVEFEVVHDLVVGAEYLGNKGTDLNSGDLARNQPDLGAMTTLLKAGKEWNWVSDAASAAAAGVPYPYAGFSNYAFMALAPYPRVAETWGPLYTVGAPLGTQTYHALQLTATKRMSNGIAASAAYTLSRSRSNIDSGFQESWGTGLLQDVTKLDAEAKTVDANDMTHVFKGFVTWELPFGNGRRFLNRSGVVDAVLGGWQLSMIFKYFSGTPMGITSSASYAGWSTYGYPIYVNATAGTDVSNQFDAGAFDITTPGGAGNRYFDPKAFSNPAYGEFGRGPRYFEQLRTFSRSYEDLGLMKNFRIGSRMRAQVRLELINILNRKYFSNPITSISNPNFGNVISLTGEPRQGQIGLRFEW
jgi:hypothetical protein